MTEIVRTRRIAAAQRTVWDVLADFGAISAWADNVDHSCMLGSAADGGGSLTPDGGAATVVSLTTTVEIGPRPPQKLAARVVARVLAKQSDVMLAGIAAYLEEPHDR